MAVLTNWRGLRRIVAASGSLVPELRILLGVEVHVVIEICKVSTRRSMSIVGVRMVADPVMRLMHWTWLVVAMLGSLTWMMKAIWRKLGVGRIL